MVRSRNPSASGSHLHIDGAPCPWCDRALAASGFSELLRLGEAIECMSADELRRRSRPGEDQAGQLDLFR